MELEDLEKTKLVEAIIEKVELREKMLMDNSIFSMTLFLDPRFNFLLTEDTKMKAKKQLRTVWKAIEAVQEKPLIVGDSTQSCSSIVDNRLDKYLASKYNKTPP